MLKRKSTVSPKIKFLIKPQSEEYSTSKALRFIFIIAHIVFALDYGFIRAKSMKKIILKIIPLLMSSALVVYLFFALPILDDSHNLWYFVYMTIYITFVILTITSKYTYNDFQTDLLAFDREIKTDPNIYKLELKLSVFTISIYMYMILNAILYYIFVPTDEQIDILCCAAFFTLTFSSDFVRITYIFLFWCTYWRICEFIKFINKDNTNIVACQYLYKNIVDITERAKSNYNFVFIVTLVFNTITVTLILFLPFAENSVKTRPSSSFIFDVMSVLKNVFVMFAPTFTAGVLAAEVEKLVLALRDKIIITKEEKLRDDIRRFIGYIEARPMKFTVCNVIPLDWNLPIIVINITVTYLIVMIQFNYKY